jgi:hypothetical protein
MCTSCWGRGYIEIDGFTALSMGIDFEASGDSQVVYLKKDEEPPTRSDSVEVPDYSYLDDSIEINWRWVMVIIAVVVTVVIAFLAYVYYYLT